VLDYWGLYVIQLGRLGSYIRNLGCGTLVLFSAWRHIAYAAWDILDGSPRNLPGAGDSQDIWKKLSSSVFPGISLKI
jgi:hypothetical protein